MSVSRYVSTVDGLVIEFTEWDDNNIHRISSKVIGEMPIYDLSSPVESSTKDYYRTRNSGSEAVNAEVQKKLQEDFLKARGLTS